MSEPEPFAIHDSRVEMERQYDEFGSINDPREMRKHFRGDATSQGDRPVEFWWPEPLDLQGLAACDPQPPRFIVRDWLPAGYATLFAGHGGVGKSAIALHLAVCIALGIPFFGVPVERRCVLYLSCEDRANVLHWRLMHICRYLAVSMADLAGWLFLHDLVGADCVLWERDPRTGFTTTDALLELRERIKKDDVCVLFVDGAADTFAGNENARSDVKRYVNALLANIPTDGAVVLIGHVAKPAASAATTTEGYSGSTQWHNGVRSRWYLRPEVAQDEDERQLRTGNLQLELQKSNLGPVNQTMTFRWDDDAHLFVGKLDTIATGGGIVDGIRERTEQRGILKAIAASTDAGMPVPAAMQGPRTAYFVLSGRPEFPEALKGGHKAAKRRFARHIEALRQIRHLVEGSYRRSNRHTVAVFDITSEGRAEYVNSL